MKHFVRFTSVAILSAVTILYSGSSLSTAAVDSASSTHQRLSHFQQKGKRPTKAEQPSRPEVRKPSRPKLNSHNDSDETKKVLKRFPGSTAQLSSGTSEVVLAFDPEAASRSELWAVPTTSRKMPEKRVRSDFNGFDKVTINFEGKTIEGYKDPYTKEVYFRASDLPPKIQNNPEQLRSLITAPSASPQTALRRPLSVGIKESDRLAAKGQYDQANRQVNNLIAIHGPKPELLLRRGLNQLSQRTPQAGAAISQTAKETDLRNQEKYFNEVNKRLAANSSLPEGESVSLAKVGSRMDFHYRVAKPFVGSAVKPEAIKEARPLVYRQDDPSLNNLDWNVPIRQSLQTVVESNQGTVVKFSNEGISSYRPGKLFVEGREYRLLENAKTIKQHSGNRQRGTGSKTKSDVNEIGDCTPEQKSRGLCQPHTVYLIQAKPDQ